MLVITRNLRTPTDELLLQINETEWYSETKKAVSQNAIVFLLNSDFPRQRDGKNKQSNIALLPPPQKKPQGDQQRSNKFVFPTVENH